MVALITRRKALDDIASDSHLWQSIERYVIAKIHPIFQQLYLGGVQAGIIVARHAGAKARISKADEERFLAMVQQPWFAARTAMILTTYEQEWWTALNKVTRTELLGAIMEAREQGLGVADVISRIEPFFGAARAERIAVTETTRLFGAGAQASYQELGVQSWEWRTANDDLVDDLCEELAASGPYAMSDQFEPAHPNCRCWPAPSVEG